MWSSYFIKRLIISGIGILMTVTIFPVLFLVGYYYDLNELLGIEENTFAISSLILTLIIFLFLFKYKQRDLSAIIFSFFYYFFIPSAYLQLRYYDTTDGQIAFAIFPIYIGFSIALFFILMLFDNNVNDKEELK